MNILIQNVLYLLMLFFNAFISIESWRNNIANPLVKMSIEGCYICEYRNSNLQNAIRQGDVKKALALINAGANVRQRIRQHNIDYRNMPADIVRQIRNSKEPTLLMFVVAQKQHKLVNLILKKGAPVNSRGDYLITESSGSDATTSTSYSNVTALHLAAYTGDTYIINRLIRRGASLDARDAEGQTPLLLAVNVGQSSVASCLLKARCNPNIGDIRGDVPLKIAAQNGYMEIYNLLKQAGAVGSYHMSDGKVKPY